MSFTYRFLFLALTLVSLCTSCEDKKKASEVKVDALKEKNIDSIQEKDALSGKNKSNPDKYPKITNENVVEFLTSYGKENPETKVLINTQHGTIEIELYKDTPLHRANFIYLVKQKYFDGTFFHRVVPNFIIQGGNSDLRSTPKKRAEIGKDYLLPAELDQGRVHSYGSISGAKEYRENPDKKSAPFEFFIFLGPKTSTSHLNGNYTVFAQVTKGMDIVKKIANLETESSDEWPLENVYLEIKVME